MSVFGCGLLLFGVIFVIYGVTETEDAMVKPILYLTIGAVVVILPYLLEAMAEPEEYTQRQLCITTSLMLCSNTVHI